MWKLQEEPPFCYSAIVLSFEQLTLSSRSLAVVLILFTGFQGETIRFPKDRSHAALASQRRLISDSFFFRLSTTRSCKVLRENPQPTRHFAGRGGRPVTVIKPLPGSKFVSRNRVVLCKGTATSLISIWHSFQSLTEDRDRLVIPKMAALMPGEILVYPRNDTVISGGPAQPPSCGNGQTHITSRKSVIKSAHLYGRRMAGVIFIKMAGSSRHDSCWWRKSRRLWPLVVTAC